MRPGLLLALDTSTAQAGVAVYDGTVKLETIWWAGRNHARQLMPAVQWALEQMGRSPRDLTAIAAARGPGSFTGLRVGLAAAQGLAFALKLPMYGIESLDVLANGLPLSPWPIRAVLDAGRGRFATALYWRDDDRWVRSEPIVGVDLDGLLRLVVGRCTVTGDLTDEASERLRELGERVWIAPAAFAVRRPAVLAELAWRSWSAGVPPKPQDGEPIYLTRV